MVELGGTTQLAFQQTQRQDILAVFSQESCSPQFIAFLGGCDTVTVEAK